MTPSSSQPHQQQQQYTTSEIEEQPQLSDDEEERDLEEDEEESSSSISSAEEEEEEEEGPIPQISISAPTTFTTLEIPPSSTYSQPQSPQQHHKYIKVSKQLRLIFLIFTH